MIPSAPIVRAAAEPPAVATDAARAVLADLAHATGATGAAVQLHDELGRVLHGIRWSLSPAHEKVVARLGPALQVLTLLSGLHDHWWASRPGLAVPVPQSQIESGPHHDFIHGPLGESHLVTCAQPVHVDGSQVVVTLARAEGDPFGPRELRLIERACAERAHVLAAPLTARTARVPSPASAEHSLHLDTEMNAPAISLYLEVLLALFYGPVLRSADGTVRLPPMLERDIPRYRDDYLRWVQSPGGSFHHAFTKRHRGRVLCLAVQSEPNGSTVLTAHEDVSQHERLRRIKAACRALERDRSAVFTACLLVAEGINSTAEIARSAGFGSHKASSALRIVNRARAIVAAL